MTRIRAAASSIASGSPSSRRQISATAPTGSWSRSKSGLPALARSANNVVASSTGSGATGAIRSPSTPSASLLVASTDDVRAMPNDLVDQPRGRGQDVLAVVHHQQHRARPQKLDHGGLDAEALLLLQPQCRSDGVTDSRTVIERSELAEGCPVVELLFQPTGDLEGQSGLSDAADAGQRHQRTARARAPETAAMSSSRAMKLVMRRGTPVRGRVADETCGAGGRTCCPGSPSRIC